MSSSRIIDLLTDLAASGKISAEDYEKALLLEKERGESSNAASTSDDAAQAPKHITSHTAHADRGESLLDDSPERSVRQVGTYDRTNPHGRPSYTPTQHNNPPEPLIPIAVSPSISTKSNTTGDCLVASVASISLGKREEDVTQGQEPLASTKKGGAATKGLAVPARKGRPLPGGSIANPRKVGATAKGTRPTGAAQKGAPQHKGAQSTAQKSGAQSTAQKGGAQSKGFTKSTTQKEDDTTQVLGLRISTKESETRLPAHHSRDGPDAQRPPPIRQPSGIERNNVLQEDRLSKLGLTSDQAMGFACPWDMYLRRDNKKCTDVSCPFNHSGAGNLEHKPLMCPFWAGKGGKHARCTKPASVCKLAHYQCGHKQYGALPPGWEIRN